jgi:hypothetical protein
MKIFTTLFAHVVEVKPDVKHIIRERAPVDDIWDDHFAPVCYDGARLLSEVEAYELTFKAMEFYKERQ